MSQQHNLGLVDPSVSHQPVGVLGSDWLSPFYQNAQPSTYNPLYNPYYQQYFPQYQDNVTRIGNPVWNQNQHLYRNDYGGYFNADQKSVFPFGILDWNPGQLTNAPEETASCNEQIDEVARVKREVVSPIDNVDVKPNIMELVSDSGKEEEHSDSKQVDTSQVTDTEDDEPFENKYSFGDLRYISKYEALVHPQKRRIFNINRDSKDYLTAPALVDISLENGATWLKYHKQVHEMMVVNTGRLIFPHFSFRLTRADPEVEYMLGIKLLQSEEQFEYKDGEWVVWKPAKRAKTVEKETNEMYSIPKSGAELMEKGLAFDRLKIYNIGLDHKKGRNSKVFMTEEKLEKTEKEERERARSMICVITRRKYLPVVTVYKVSPSGEMRPIQSVSFEEASFIATTSYRNPEIRDMKTLGNKYVTSGKKMNVLNAKNKTVMDAIDWRAL